MSASDEDDDKDVWILEILNGGLGAVRYNNMVGRSRRYTSENMNGGGAYYCC